MARSRLLRHGLGLTLCAFAAKVVGALYRLPLTNLLGAQGMGGYQLVFPVYAFVLALTSSAMPLLLARQIVKDARFGYAVFRRSIDLMALLGAAGALFLLAWAYPLAGWQGYPAMVWGYVMMAPAILAVALAAPFRGWFQANMHWGALAGFAMCEQVLKLSGLGFAYLVRSRGVAAMATAALGGVALAEVVAAVLCVVLYRALGYRFGAAPCVVRPAALWRSSLPITAANLVMPAVQFGDSLLLTNLCVWAGMPMAQAVQDYGVLTGAVGTLTTLPVVLAMSFATLVVPVVSRAMHGRDIVRLRRGSADTLYVVLALCLPCALGMALLAPEVVGLLYPRLLPQHRQLAATLMRVMCLGIPAVCLQQLYAVLLQSVEHSRVVARQLAWGGGLRITVCVAAVPFWGMLGAAVAHVACYVVLAAWHGYTYRTLTGRYHLARPLARCALAGGVMAVLVWALTQILSLSGWRVVPIALLAAAVYGILLWALGGIRWLSRPNEEKT